MVALGQFFFGEKGSEWPSTDIGKLNKTIRLA